MKIIMPTARKSGKNKMDVSSTHITTMSMTQLRPVNILYGIQGDTFNVDYGQFTRLSPLVSPTYGSFTLKTFAFWIPLRVIWSDYQNYMENTPDGSVRPETLNFSLKDLCDLLYPSREEFLELTNSSPAHIDGEKYDIMFYEGSLYYYYRFNERGRQFWNLLHGLGYELPTYYNLETVGTSADYSLLPLLAYGRAMYDYIYPSAYVQQQGFGYLFSEQVYENEKWQILKDIERLCFVPYTQSYWTSLWARPNSVAVGSQSSNFTATSAEAAGMRNVLTASEYNTQIAQDNADQTMTLTSVGLRLLQSVADFTLRNNIGGTRFHEFMKSHFGFVTQEQDSTRSVFLKSFADSVRIDDVTNTTALDSVLGEQAGKGYSYTQGPNSLKFECKETGFLMFVSMIVPEIGYYQGLKPWCASINSREDLYLPEFDSLGMVGIPKRYLYNCPHSPEEATKFGNNPNQVFGYAQRYSQLKIGHDYLSGDFRLGSKNTALDSYHTFRDITYNRDNLALDAQFLHVDNQYQRIFSNMGEEISQGEFEQLDTFFTIFHFKVAKYTHMLSIAEAMPFFNKEGDYTSVDYEGNQI